MKRYPLAIFKTLLRILILPIFFLLYLKGAIKYGFGLLVAWLYPPTKEDYKAKMEAFRRAHDARVNKGAV